MDDVTKLVRLALIVLAVGGVLRWLQRRADDPNAAVDLDTRELVLRYGTPLRVVLPCSCAALAVGAAVYALVTPPSEADPGPASAWVLTLLFGVSTIAVLLMTRSVVRYDAERVVGGRPGGPQTVIAWEEVKRVTYSKTWHGVVLHAPGKRSITAGLYMEGAADFVAAVRENVDRNRRRDFEDEIAKRKGR